MPPPQRGEFKAGLRAAEGEVRAGAIESYAEKKDSHWNLWLEFCLQRKLDPFLRNWEDPIPVLQVFARQYRDGRIAPSQDSVRSRTVEDALRSVGQKHSRMGSKDPRLCTNGKVDFRISRQLRCWSKQDPAPDRVKPLPVTVVMSLLTS